MTEPLTVQDSWGRQALDTRQAYERFQFSVKSGCAVSINTGTLGQTDTLSVASGTVYFNGSSVSVSSQNAQIDAANASHPRKDVVYIDTNGDAQVAKGTAEAQQPDKFDGDTWEETYRPAPEDLSSTNAVVLAEVWVGAGVSSLGANLSTASNAVRDRRLNADLVLNTLTTEEVVNSAIGDSVDYIDPFWLAQTDYWFNIHDTVSLDSWSQTTTGSASINLVDGVISIDTGATNDSEGTVYLDQAYRSGGRARSFDKDSKIRFAMRNVDSDDNITAYLSTSTYQDSGTQAYGVKLENNSLMVFAHDGTTESTTELIANPGTGFFDCLVEFTAGSQVSATVNGNTGSVSSNLPSGTEGAPMVCEFYVNNNTAAQRRVRINPVHFVMSS